MRLNVFGRIACLFDVTVTLYFGDSHHLYTDESEGLDVEKQFGSRRATNS